MVRKNSAKFSPHRAKSTPCLQIPVVLVEQLQVHLRDEHKMKDATSAEKTKELEEEHRRELERRRRWERQQRAAAKRKIEDDDDEDDDQGDRSGKRKKDDDPGYRPSKKQLKKADKRGDK